MEELGKEYASMSRLELDAELTKVKMTVAQCTQKILLLKAELKKKNEAEHLEYLASQPTSPWIKAIDERNAAFNQSPINGNSKQLKSEQIGGELDIIASNGRKRFEHISVSRVCAENTLNESPSDSMLRDAILNAIANSKTKSMPATEVFACLKGKLSMTYERVVGMIKRMLESGDLGLTYKGGVRHYEVKI